MEALEEKSVEFTMAERQYLAEQRLLRVSTMSPGGEVEVAPVGLHFDGERFSIVGMDLWATVRWKKRAEQPQCGEVFDDLASVDPWRQRGIEIRGRAEIGITAQVRRDLGDASAEMELGPEVKRHRVAEPAGAGSHDL